MWSEFNDDFSGIMVSIKFLPTSLTCKLKRKEKLRFDSWLFQRRSTVSSKNLWGATLPLQPVGPVHHSWRRHGLFIGVRYELNWRYVRFSFHNNIIERFSHVWYIAIEGSAASPVSKRATLWWDIRNSDIFCRLLPKVFRTFLSVQPTKTPRLKSLLGLKKPQW